MITDYDLYVLVVAVAVAVLGLVNNATSIFNEQTGPNFSRSIGQFVRGKSIHCRQCCCAPTLLDTSRALREYRSLLSEQQRRKQVCLSRQRVCVFNGLLNCGRKSDTSVPLSPPVVRPPRTSDGHPVALFGSTRRPMSIYPPPPE